MIKVKTGGRRSIPVPASQVLAVHEGDGLAAGSSLGAGGGLTTPKNQAQSYSFVPFNQQTKSTHTAVSSVYNEALFNGLGGITLTPTGASPVAKFSLPAVVDLSGATTIQIGVNNNNPAAQNTLMFIVYFTSDLQTNWAIYNIDLRGAPPASDVYLSINKATRSNQSAGYSDALWSTVYGFAFTQTSQTVSADTFFSVSNIKADLRFVSSVFLSMDHGYKGQYSLAMPALEKYGLKGAATVFLRKDVLGGGVYGNLADVLAAQEDGYTIGLHSFNKPMDTTGLVAFPDAASITDEINGFHAWASSNGINSLREVQPIAINDPFIGSLTLQQMQDRAKGYRDGGVKVLRRGNQTYNAGRNNNLAMGGPGSIIQTYLLIAATTNSNIDTWLQSAIDRKELISIYWHDVKLSGATGGDCNVAQVEYLASKLAEFASKGLMQIAKPSDFI